MKDPSLQREALYERRSAEFLEFAAQSGPALLEFAELLQIRPAEKMLSDPTDLPLRVEQLLENEALEISDEDRAWLHSRLMYLVGWILNIRHGGTWLLCEDPNSSCFLRYVIGRFNNGEPPGFVIDPFSAIDDFLNEKTGRKFTAVLARLEASVVAAKSIK